MAIVSIIHDYALENENLSKIYGLDDPNLKMFTASEQENFNTHLVQSADLSKHFNDFTEVDFIISQHHELPNGTGFPHGHNGFKIAKISAIFILASNLVTKLVHMGNRKGMLELIITEFSESYKVGSFKEPLIKLIEVFFNKNP